MYTPPFNITDEIITLVSEISESVGGISALMADDLPHPMLRKQNRIKTIQSSLAIENNSLTINQVTAIMEGKRVLGPPNEILEVQGALVAYDLLLTINPHSEKDLLKAHKSMMKDLIDNNGKYRNSGVGVYSEKGWVHIAPPAERVPMLMKDLFEWVKTTKTHPLISSCVFHYEFEFIHPFADGNGRMGRFWQTALLSKWKPIFAWLPVETIVKSHQQEYYNAIAASDANGECTVFVRFMLNCLKQAISDVATPIASLKTSPIDIIISLIRKNQKVTIQDMSAALGINRRNVQNKLNQMVADGLIRRVGSSRSGYWEVL